ncbi:hypothetical protein GCM10007416_24690 [Kroppenstedtia guangzhouensis]|uniref:Uncharacterized protein n=1 Tax=Kroppenstedtia guangzhouensis TaxID=1274356 RepID=A0ABQ1GV59_9BACL|nr:hypothetical protein GCM10007416_24690 [Kroppenstedtia guangzhouensis]
MTGSRIGETSEGKITFNDGDLQAGGSVPVFFDEEKGEGTMIFPAVVCGIIRSNSNEDGR